MSVQLIVHPQNYQGFDSIIATATNEYIVDGINFNTVNNSTEQAVTLPNGTQEAIDFYNPTMAVNTWFRYYEGTSGVSEATVLSLIVLSTQPQQGILQKLSNLTVGGVYNITIDINSIVDSTNAFGVWIYSGTILQYVLPLPTVSGITTLQFTANSTEDTIVIVGNSTISQSLLISSISVENAIPQPSGAIQLLGDGQVICDLYEDEDLPLTLSVDNFKNVAEKVQSYSKAFNLPATKRNNRIFDQMFEVTRSNDGIIFNPYKKTKCILKQDGFILFEGYLRMLDITDKEGEISYNVNLYSEVVALADILKDREFSNLSFTELEHNYNKTEIKASWNPSGTGIAYTNPSTSGFRDANSTLKYPFVDWNHQFIVGGSGAGGATIGNPELPTLETAFRPFINIKYLIDRIFEATDFTYDSTFFATDDFKKLYMDFNWGADNAPIVFDSTGELTNAGDFNIPNANTTIPFDEMNASGVVGNGNALDANFGYSAGVFTAQEDNQVYTIDYSMRFSQGGLGTTMVVEWLVNGVSVNIQPTQSANFVYAGSFTTGVAGVPLLSAGDTILCRAISSSVVPNWDLLGVGVPGYTGITPYLVRVTTSLAQTTSDTLLGTLRGELGQWEFLKGLITMFNLVTLPDEDNPNNIKIEPYADVFINSTDSVQLNWTEKIDVSEMKLTPLTELNKETIFKFVEDDDDYSFNRYKELVGGHLYGSKEYPAGNEFNILEGKEEILAEPFAATVIKPLIDIFPDFITPAIYAAGGDGVWEGFENSPRIMYDNGIKDTGASYYIPAQNGLFSENQTDFLQFSHLSDIPTITSSPPLLSDTKDCHFGVCQLVPGGVVPIVNNLFGMYWLPYYSELYNPNTRTMTINVNLSPADINTFKFNDTVYIKNRIFRVNKIDYKPNDLATVEFILIP